MSQDTFVPAFGGYVFGSIPLAGSLGGDMPPLLDVAASGDFTIICEGIVQRVALPPRNPPSVPPVSRGARDRFWMPPEGRPRGRAF